MSCGRDYDDDDGPCGDEDGYEDVRDPVEFGDVEAVRQTDRGLLVRFPDGTERWLSKKHVDASSGVRRPGDRGELVVSGWVARRWEEEPVEAEAPVEVPGCVCLGKTRSGLAIEVRLPDGTEVLLPLSQVLADSEVRDDGDAGTLRVSRWIAEKKGLLRSSDAEADAESRDLLGKDDVPW